MNGKARKWETDQASWVLQNLAAQLAVAPSDETIRDAIRHLENPDQESDQGAQVSGPSRKQWVRITAAWNAWAVAIADAAAEHGRPNSFGVIELATQWHNLRRRDGYYIGDCRLFELWQALGGAEKWGSCPTYHHGRFYV